VRINTVHQPYDVQTSLQHNRNHDLLQTMLCRHADITCDYPAKFK